MRNLQETPHTHVNHADEIFPDNPEDWVTNGITNVEGCHPCTSDVKWSSLGAVRICCVLPRKTGRKKKYVIECFDNKDNRRSNLYVHALATDEDLQTIISDKKVELFKLRPPPIKPALAAK